MKPMNYKITGDRAGYINIKIAGKIGQLAWELLTGESMVAIYSSDCRWTDPQSLPMKQTEVEQLAQMIANDKNVQIEVSVENGFKIIRPDSV